MCKKKVWALVVAFITAFGLVTSANAEVDFSGKTIKWIIPFSVGGGSDVWARLYAPYLQKYLPGNPTIVIKNMPGGGSIVGANYFHERARPDGLTIFGSSGSTTFPYLLGNSKVKYDFSKYHIVLASSTGGVVYINPDLGVKSAADLKGFKKELVYASQGVTSLDLVPLLAFDMLGLNVKAVFGYKGRGAGRVAFEQGEVNIDYQTSTAYIENVRPLVEMKKAIPLMTWGVLDEEGNIVRDPIEPDLPCFPEVYEMVHGKKPSGPAWEAWKAFFVAGFAVQKAVWLPEKTPAEIVAVWREAAKKTIEDPEFQKVIEKNLGGYKQYYGEKAAKAFQSVLDVPPESKAWVLKWIKDKYGVTVD
ncbi:Bug family tripartite tricarboxylate transporter substrate binding protein [Thermodesulforhabdus norvegica]|uniref:Tripartite-type tricarboxylate transporter, receptor component TctC n=1 Tax=Thermodesulforhabdus norvegica TaxID=39841 RepID=A0A1I4QF42_9BACT|nr:tripartite tricarboxylate transporter substrate-binding protein [Thermodesulforhabdus norvegica]SFM38742.1 Tripartite-type tricarboxylate transporter, receptor component TctC [Thermodesulforhabdus norvegica]